MTESTGDVLKNYHSRYDDLALEMEREYFKGQVKDGFFVEAGASSGEESSHSLYFELSQGWTGLLVEPLPTALNFKNRRATVSGSCLATQPRPHYVHFNTNTTAVLDSEHNIQAMGGIFLVTEMGEELYY